LATQRHEGSRETAAAEEGGGSFDRATAALLGAAHLAHDSYPAFVGVLLPILIGRLGISLAVAGVLASSIRWSSIIGNPLLGYLGDRRDTRYWIALAPAATALCISFLVLAPSLEVALLLLLAAGLSHATFHSSAGAMATRVAGRRWGRGASYFMTGGEVARSIGPLFIAAVLAVVGTAWAWLAAVPGLLASGLLFGRLRRVAPVSSTGMQGDLRRALRTGWRWVALLATAILLRGLANTGFIIFYPTYATDAGSSLLLAGAGVAAYELGGIVGTFVAGPMSDRFGRGAVMALGIALGVPCLVLALVTGFGPPHFVLLACAGLGLVSPGPVQLVVMQELFPADRGAAAGMNFFMAGLGAIVATVAVGIAASGLGLQTALLAASVLAALAVPLVLALPETRPATLGTRATK
jgi:MFS transporter, FSR family, fosmidomycin resistance protein